ncbi:hypothetical protein lerEdw1_010107 [Lerista edwardsae]|nr:hypothetical protein lerEdw1_010107 [Lerista edwardsae]
MKVLLSLTVLCLTLALAQGACFHSLLKAELNEDGKLVMPDGCTDPYDKTMHPFGSAWDTAECMHCDCAKDGLQCCTRYGGVVSVPGCKAVLDEEACKYVLYKEDDPTALCPIQL